MKEASAKGFRARVLDLFERRYLRRGDVPGVESEIDSRLGDKLAQIERRHDPEQGRLLEVTRQLRVLWQNRSRLSRKHVVYLAGALLYLVNPLDVLPDPLPVIGFSDDLVVLVFVLGMVLEAVQEARDILKEGALEVVEEGEAAASRAAETLVPRSVAAVTIGLWGATTAAAVSLALAVTTGGLGAEWAVYGIVVAAMIGAWNLTSAVRLVRQFRRLDGSLQERLARIFASKVTAGHLAALLLPVILLISLGLARVLLP